MIKKLMTDRQWWTIPELQRAAKARKKYMMETSISARIRDIRKAGGNVISRRRNHSKLWEYKYVR